MPDLTLDSDLYVTAFVTVLVLMDPIGNVPIFLGLTRDLDEPQRNRFAVPQFQSVVRLDRVGEGVPEIQHFAGPRLALVVGDNPGAAKITKAESFDVPVLDEDGFEHLLATGELPPA